MKEPKICCFPIKTCFIRGDKRRGDCGRNTYSSVEGLCWYCSDCFHCFCPLVSHNRRHSPVRWIEHHPMLSIACLRPARMKIDYNFNNVVAVKSFYRAKPTRCEKQRISFSSLRRARIFWFPLKNLPSRIWWSNKALEISIPPSPK